MGGMERHKRIYLASLAGIFLNLGLVAIKAVIGVVSGSVSVMTDAVNNLTDTLSAVVTLVGTKLAQKKPDKEHPYGHGRIEYVAAILVGLIIFSGGVGAVLQSVPLIREPRVAKYSVVSVAMIAMTVVIKLGFGKYLQRVGKETRSRSLQGAGVDAMFDALLSFGTLVGAGVSLAFGISIDGWIGVVIAAFIVRSAVEMTMKGLEDIIGKRVDEKFARKIKVKIMSFPEVRGVKQLVLHDYGSVEATGSVRVEVEPKMTIGEFGELAKRIEQAVREEYNVKLVVGVA